MFLHFFFLISLMYPLVSTKCIPLSLTFPPFDCEDFSFICAMKKTRVSCVNLIFLLLCANSFLILFLCVCMFDCSYPEV